MAHRSHQPRMVRAMCHVPLYIVNLKSAKNASMQEAGDALSNVENDCCNAEVGFPSS